MKESATTPTRYALVAPLTRQLADALLPDNYRLVGLTADGTRSIIAGRDNDSWKLDADVLPRLAADLCGGTEIDETEAQALLRGSSA